MQNLQVGQFAHINIFTLKQGRRDLFIELQCNALPVLGEIPGFRGSQLYRGRDSDTVIQIAFFVDEDAHRRFQASEAFRQHRQRLLPLIDAANPGFFNLANLVESPASL